MARNKGGYTFLFFKKKEAYSLIETLIIVGLIAVLAGVAITRFRSDYFSSFSLEMATHQIVTDLRLTRRLAITKAEDYKLIIYPPEHQYRIFDGANNQIGETKEIPLEITVNGDTEFTFQSSGNTVSGGIFYLIINGESYQVTVLQSTGKVGYAKI